MPLYGWLYGGSGSNNKGRWGLDRNKTGIGLCGSFMASVININDEKRAQESNGHDGFTQHNIPFVISLSSSSLFVNHIRECIILR